MTSKVIRALFLVVLRHLATLNVLNLFRAFCCVICQPDQKFSPRQYDTPSPGLIEDVGLPNAVVQITDVVQVFLRHLPSAPYLICVCLSHLDVKAQPSRPSTTIDIVQNYHPQCFPVTGMQFFAHACPHVRFIQRSPLLCDIITPHLNVEVTCVVEVRSSMETAFREYSLHVHHEHPAVTPVAPRSRFTHACSKSVSHQNPMHIGGLSSFCEIRTW